MPEFESRLFLKKESLLATQKKGQNRDSCDSNSRSRHNPIVGYDRSRSRRRGRSNRLTFELGVTQPNYLHCPNIWGMSHASFSARILGNSDGLAREIIGEIAEKFALLRSHVNARREDALDPWICSLVSLQQQWTTLRLYWSVLDSSKKSDWRAPLRGNRSS